MCDVRFYKHGTIPAMEITDTTNGNVWNMRTERGIRYFKTLPSLKSLEKMVYDSVCKSVTGHVCEPDGYGPDGSPSWLIVMGMI